MVTPNQTLVTEEQEKRFLELNAKKERTEDETKELEGLKTNYANTAKGRIDKLSGEKKAEKAAREAAEARAEKAEKEAEELKKEQAALATPETIVGNENETLEVGGKKWFTDAALSAQIKSGKITEAAAVDYQTKRNRTDMVIAVKEDIKKEQATEEASKLRLVDANQVLEQHPNFNAKHPDHNSNDPLYKLSIELYNDGLGLKPDGFSKSVKRAKQILGIKDTPVDRSSDLSVEEGGAPGDKGGKPKDKEVPFTEQEEQMAIEMFCRGDSVNPKTQRAYTRDEAIAVAKEAKRARRRT